MTDYRLYVVGVPGQARTTAESRQRRQVASEGSVSASQAATEPLGVDAKTENLVLQYKGYNAEMLAEQMEELAGNNSGFKTVPFYRADGGRSPVNGFYTLETQSRSRQDPRMEELPQFQGDLKFVGTQKEIWRGVAVQAQQVDNPFGNLATKQIGLNENVNKAIWFNNESQTRYANREYQSPAEDADTAVYDTTDVTFDSPTLLYELPYEHTGQSDLRVWDTRGYTLPTREVDGHQVLEWQRVFSTSHEFEGKMVIDNGQTRLYMDDGAAHSMKAERWDSVNDRWEPKSLGTGFNKDYWGPLDVDLNYIGPARVSGRVRFTYRERDGDIFADYRLNFDLTRSNLNPLWYVPPPLEDTAGDIPPALYNKLDPLTDESTIRMNPHTVNLQRDEVEP